MTSKIFVFGSNLSGIHGTGAAQHALAFHGAKWGRGEGLQGQSYALPTKDEKIQTLPLDFIRMHSVRRFLEFAWAFQTYEFTVTAVGCGLAGYTPDQIAPMFAKAPKNCLLPKEFLQILERNPTL